MTHGFLINGSEDISRTLFRRRLLILFFSGEAEQKPVFESLTTKFLSHGYQAIIERQRFINMCYARALVFIEALATVWTVCRYLGGRFGSGLRVGFCGSITGFGSLNKSRRQNACR